jgi:myo-inositol-1(or 4)-monophosphatase
MTKDIEDRLAAAVAVAREAGKIAQEAYEAAPTTRSRAFKGPQDYVLESDAVVERVIRERLLAAFPGDSFFGEEAGGDFGRDVWVVDPIDGTANFARGIPHWCISIAFVRDMMTEVGVIYQPPTDEMYASRRGARATLNGRPMKVSGLTDVRQAMVEVGWSGRAELAPYVALVDRVFRVGGQMRRGGSGALGLAYTADGRIDGYGELHMNSWDALAGLLLVEEAGGWTYEFLSADVDGLRDGNVTLACTPALKEIMCDAMGLRLRR